MSTEIAPKTTAPELNFKALEPAEIKNLSADKLASMSKDQATYFLNDPKLYNKVKENLPSEDAKKALDKAITEATSFLNETAEILGKGMAFVDLLVGLNMDEKKISSTLNSEDFEAVKKATWHVAKKAITGGGSFYSATTAENDPKIGDLCISFGIGEPVNGKATFTDLSVLKYETRNGTAAYYETGKISKKEAGKETAKEVPQTVVIQIAQGIINQNLSRNYPADQAAMFAQQIIGGLPNFPTNNLTVVQVQQIAVSICQQVEKTCGIKLDVSIVVNQLMSWISLSNTVPGSINTLNVMNPSLYESGKYKSPNSPNLNALRTASGGVVASVDATEFAPGEKSDQFYKDYSDAANQLMVAYNRGILDATTMAWIDSLGGLVDAFGKGGKNALNGSTANIYKAGGLFNLLLAWQRAVDVCPQLATLASNPVQIASLNGQKVLLVQGTTVKDASARMASRGVSQIGGMTPGMQIPGGMLMPGLYPAMPQQIVVVAADGSMHVYSPTDITTTITDSYNNNNNPEVKIDIKDSYNTTINITDKSEVGTNDASANGPESPEYVERTKASGLSLNEVEKRLLTNYKTLEEFDTLVTPAYKAARRLVFGTIRSAKNNKENEAAVNLLDKLTNLERAIAKKRAELAPTGPEAEYMKLFSDADLAVENARKAIEGKYSSPEEFDKAANPLILEADRLVNLYKDRITKDRTYSIDWETVGIKWFEKDLKAAPFNVELAVSLVLRLDLLKKASINRKNLISGVKPSEAPVVAPGGTPVEKPAEKPAEGGKEKGDGKLEPLPDSDIKEATDLIKEATDVLGNEKFEDVDSFDEEMNALYDAAELAVMSISLKAEASGDRKEISKARGVERKLDKLYRDIVSGRASLLQDGSEVEPDLKVAHKHERKVNQQKDVISYLGGKIKYALSEEGKSKEGEEGEDVYVLLEEIGTHMETMKTEFAELVKYANVMPDDDEDLTKSDKMVEGAKKNISIARKVAFESRLAIEADERGMPTKLNARKLMPYKDSKENKYKRVLMNYLDKNNYDFVGWWSDEKDARAKFTKEFLKICEEENIAPFALEKIAFFDKENDKMYNTGKKEGGRNWWYLGLEKKGGDVDVSEGDNSFSDFGNLDSSEKGVFEAIRQWIRSQKGNGGKFEYFKV